MFLHTLLRPVICVLVFRHQGEGYGCVLSFAATSSYACFSFPPPRTRRYCLIASRTSWSTSSLTTACCYPTESLCSKISLLACKGGCLSCCLWKCLWMYGAECLLNLARKLTCLPVELFRKGADCISCSSIIPLCPHPTLSSCPLAWKLIIDYRLYVVEILFGIHDCPHSLSFFLVTVLVNMLTTFYFSIYFYFFTWDGAYCQWHVP